MAEAIVVISVMIGFLGLIVWTRNAYGMKLDVQQGTRSSVLYSASHGCEAEGGGNEEGPVGEAPNGARQAPNAGAAETTTKWNSVQASNNASVDWASIQDNNAAYGGGGRISYGRRPLHANVKAFSYCTCNEKKYDNQLTAWAKFGFNLIRSGGGFPW
jgi:hypothetical protein